MIERRIDIPIYGFPFSVILCNSKEFAEQYPEEAGAPFVGEGGQGDKPGTFKLLLNEDYMENGIGDPVVAGIIAHECSHIAFEVFDYIQESQYNSEPMTYLIQWLVEKTTGIIKEYLDESNL